MSAPLLEVRDLRTEFRTRGGTLRAVNGVSLSVTQGEIVGLVGESGSGKSVTGFSILGLIEAPGRIAAGSIRLEGRELVGLSHRALRGVRGRRVAMVFQDPAATLNPLLTIGQQMRLALSAHRTLAADEARERCVRALRQVGIPDPEARLESYPHQFSGGMRQRVCIAIALINEPRLIVCDEPTTALDVSIQAQILSEMRKLVRETGVSLIWISHDLAVVSALADRVMVMYAGRIVERGPTRETLRAPRHPYTAGLLASLPASIPPGAPLAQIAGSPPSLIDPSPGCAFAPRCPRAAEPCRAEPPWSEEGARAARCWFPLEGPAP